MTNEDRYKEYLKKYNLSDEKIKQIIDILYCLSENIIRNYLKKCLEELRKNS